MPAATEIVCALGFRDNLVARSHECDFPRGQFFNRPGPRIAETLEITAEILHPQMFRFGHEGAAWRRLACE